jgi:hypothetical protein
MENQNSIKEDYDPIERLANFIPDKTLYSELVYALDTLRDATRFVCLAARNSGNDNQSKSKKRKALILADECLDYCTDGIDEFKQILKRRKLLENHVTGPGIDIEAEMELSEEEEDEDDEKTEVLPEPREPPRTKAVFNWTLKPENDGSLSACGTATLWGNYGDINWFCNDQSKNRVWNIILDTSFEKIMKMIIITKRPVVLEARQMEPTFQKEVNAVSFKNSADFYNFLMETKQYFFTRQ